VSTRNHSSSLERQASTWTGPEAGGPQASILLKLYTTTWAIGGTPAQVALPAVVAPWIEMDGYNGSIMVEVSENNVGAASAVNLEGSNDGANWYALGYYPIVVAGATQASLTRTVTALSVLQNNRYVLQILDAYPLMRVRPSTNVGSLNAVVYAVPA
jgi:hypothetical protein